MDDEEGRENAERSAADEPEETKNREVGDV